MFTRLRLVKVVAAAALLGAISPVTLAQTSTSASMTVSLTVPKSCSMSVAQNVAFGTQSVSASTLLSAGGTTGGTRGLISVTCRAQADSVTVALSSASTSSSGGGNMSDGSSTVAYNLYQPAATGWSDTDLANCNYAGTLTAWPGTGLALTPSNSATKSIAVCARATIDENTPSGSYSDSVTVTLTY